jgi:hypothetical protein
MPYKEGDIILIIANVVNIDDEDDTLQVDIQGTPLWITETCIAAIQKPRFELGELVSINGDLYFIDQINYSTRQNLFQYKVDGHWFDENELEKQP